MLMSVAVMRRRLRLSYNDKSAIGGSEHLDRSFEESREIFCCYYLMRSPRHGATRTDIDDAIEIGEDRVYVVCDHHDGDALDGTDVMDQGGDCSLIREIKTVEWLIQEEDLWTLHECLCDEESLLLAARELTDGSICVVTGTDEFNDVFDPTLLPGTVAAYRQRKTPSCAI
jgi:hypothetical protein